MAAREAAETLYGASRDPASSWSCMAGLYIYFLVFEKRKAPAGAEVISVNLLIISLFNFHLYRKVRG